MVTARIKEGAVELHSMHCSAQVLEEERGEEDLLNPKVQCSKCKLEFLYSERAERKKYKEPICNKCLSKRVLFIRMFGNWPIEPFTALSVESQIAVWQADNTKVALNNALVNAVSKQRINEDLSNEAGSYLPVSVYQTLGYKTDALETTCPKKWDVELKEWTYKKTVTTESKTEIIKKVTEDINNLRAKDLRSKLSHYASPCKRKRSKSSSSNSSEASNSSKSGVDSPKTAKAKLAKRAQEMAAEAKIEKAKAAQESKAARIRAVTEAKAKKVQEAADAKQAAKDPILISMHMHRDILVL